MYRGRGVSTANSRGFTIVETLIFLAVSMVMFVSAMLLIGGMQRKTQFVNAVRDFESNLVDIANDVSTGYYQSSATLPACKNISGEPKFQGGSTIDQGMNKDCIFIGKTIKPGAGSAESYNVYSLMGVRTKLDLVSGKNKDVADLNEAKPRLITQADTISTRSVGAGAKITCIKTNNSPSCENKIAITFMSNLSRSVSGFQSPGDSGTGIRANLFAYNLPSWDQSDLEDVVKGQDYTAAGFVSPATVQIYIQSGTTSQCGVVTLGSDNSSGLSIKSEILQGSCS